MLSVVSTRVIPAVNRAGKIITVLKLKPPDAWPAATVKRLISVAVSKPRPNSRPIANICQLAVTMRNKGRRMRARKPRPDSSRFSSCSPTCSPRPLKAVPDASQNHEVDDGNRQQEERGRSCPDDAAERPEFLKSTLQRKRGGGDARNRQCNRKRMSEREKQPDGKRTFALLHQFAH